MIKIQIKSIWGEVLFEYEKENNTLKDTLEEAVKHRANLYGANLYGANLNGANLNRANLNRASLNGANLNRASLNRASLDGANLNGASLDRASLDGANLNRANLNRASLNGANLNRASLDGASLNRASLDVASLNRASLDGANLNGANLYGASLNGASLNGASLDGATNIPFVPYACPSDGSFIGWKKVDNCLVMLEIPEDARRCSCTSQKCRCDKAKVLGITNLDTNESVSEIKNTSYSPAVTYVVGEMVYPDSFDENRWNECSHGIHFFINKQNAVDY